MGQSESHLYPLPNPTWINWSKAVCFPLAAGRAWKKMQSTLICSELTVLDPLFPKGKEESKSLVRKGLCETIISLTKPTKSFKHTLRQAFIWMNLQWDTRWVHVGLEYSSRYILIVYIGNTVQSIIRHLWNRSESCLWYINTGSRFLYITSKTHTCSKDEHRFIWVHRSLWMIVMHLLADHLHDHTFSKIFIDVKFNENLSWKFSWVVKRRHAKVLLLDGSKTGFFCSKSMAKGLHGRDLLYLQAFGRIITSPMEPCILRMS